MEGGFHRAFPVLKARHRAIREATPQDFNLRLHRALSWLSRAEAERERNDLDAAFLFYWISFNAAYAGEISETAPPSERAAIKDFFGLLLAADKEAALYRILWSQYSGPVRVLLENRFVFAPFWREMANPGTCPDWEESFARSRQAAFSALGRNDCQRVLEIVFDRLYVLRNQLVHGGATWASSANRSQVGDGARLMGALMPAILEAMLAAPSVEWGASLYPVVEV